MIWQADRAPAVPFSFAEKCTYNKWDTNKNFEEILARAPAPAVPFFSCINI